MKNHTDVLLRMEQRITNLETFINRFDFSGLPEISYACQHESDGVLHLRPEPAITTDNFKCGYSFLAVNWGKCIKCGEFFDILPGLKAGDSYGE